MNLADRRELRLFQDKSGVPARRRTERVNDTHKQIVEEGGGVYVPGMMGDLVLFNSPITRSTLALPEKELTTEAVAGRILLSNKSFGV